MNTQQYIKITMTTVKSKRYRTWIHNSIQKYDNSQEQKGAGHVHTTESHLGTLVGSPLRNLWFVRAFLTLWVITLLIWGFNIFTAAVDADRL